MDIWRNFKKQGEFEIGRKEMNKNAVLSYLCHLTWFKDGE